MAHERLIHEVTHMFELFDALLLARIQFAFTVAFHIIFPAFSIGLASYLFVLEGLWLWTGRDVYLRLFQYWLKIFAIAFGMGVVSGLVMSYQFGTNWSVFSYLAGPVIGPLMAYEVLSAFFLEAGFLGIMLFGMKRVGKGLHFAATGMVAFGTVLSATWILAVNSWMHTPAGYEINEVGQFVPVDWLAVIFNPSFPYRLVHMTLAAYLTTAFVVGATGAWHLLRGNTSKDAKKMLSMAMWMATFVAPLQILAGDFHGLNTLEHQPVKVAAMEGVWETEQGAPLLLFAIPDEQERTNHAELAIPNLASFILTHELDGEIKGLNEFRGEHPPVAPVFYSFRVMVGMGVLMLFAAWAGAYYLFRRGELPDWLGKLFIAMSFSGWVATLAGWYVTEVGRQPYLVSGVLRTADAVTGLPPQNIGLSFTLYAVIYAVLMVAYIRTLTLMCRKSVGIEEISKGDADERHTNKLDIASSNA